MKIIHIQTKRANWGGKQSMRAMSRGLLFSPGEVNGATITIEGEDPQELRTYQSVEQLLRNKGRELGLFYPQLLFMNLHPSRRKPKMWEARWELRK